VSNFVQRALEKGLAWPLPADLDEGHLEALLFRQSAPRGQFALPDYAHVHWDKIQTQETECDDHQAPAMCAPAIFVGVSS
jgi:hypothetical protein